jgi:hypothetical protein
MADRYLLESGAPDGFLLEDGSGVLILEFAAPVTDVPNALMMMGQGLAVAVFTKELLEAFIEMMGL